MCKLRNLRLLATLGAGAVVAIVAAACSDQTNLNTAPQHPNFWVLQQQCPPGKFTGGGRIDPPHPDFLHDDGATGTSTITGKVTFGFNVFFANQNNQCIATKGEIQVVHHPSKTRWHVSIHDNADDFGETVRVETFNSGHCIRVGGEAGMTGRVNGQQGSELVRMTACDWGEPGSQRPGVSPLGPDSFRWETLATASTPSTAPRCGPGGTDICDTDQTLLTGGNIKAH